MIRPYHPGDDVRHIDWNATARLQEPHVRVHVGERALTTWLVLDVSASMAFGTADRRKADVAEGVALAVGHVATRRGNRLGVLAFGGARAAHPAPAPGPPRACSALLAELRRESEARARARRRWARRSASAAALGRQRGLVVIVSDFRGERDWEAPLRALRARHGVMAVEIVDPREQELVPAGDLWLVDPETGRQVHVDTRKRRSPRPLRRGRRGRARRGPPGAARAPAPTTSSSPPAGDWLRVFAGAPAPQRGRPARRGPARAPPVRNRIQASGRTVMSFAEPILLAGFILAPARDAGLRLAAAAPPARVRGVGQPRARPRPDDRAARLAAPPAAAAAAARAVRR